MHDQIDEILRSFGIPDDGKEHINCLCGEIMYCDHSVPVTAQAIQNQVTLGKLEELKETRSFSNPTEYIALRIYNLEKELEL